MQMARTILTTALLAAFACIAGAADNAPALLAAGRVDDAISTLRGELSQTPNDAQAHNLLCRAYFAVEDWDRAATACEKAVELAPNNSNYHLWLGRTYGEKADASSFCAQAAKLAVLDDAKAHWINGRIAEKKKDLTIAEQEYRAAIRADNGSADSWLNLASFYRHTGRLNDMEKAIDQISAVPIKASVVLVDAAETLVRAGRNFPLAVQLLRRYIASGSPSEDAPTFKAHYLLGTILEKQGDKPGAAQQYSAALTLARNFSRAKDALNRVNR